MRLASALAVLLALPALAGNPALTAVEATTPRPAAEDRTVRFPARGEAGDRRFDFATELLALVLERDGGGWRVQVVGAMNQPRAAQSAREGHVDVVMLPHVAKGDSGLLPVVRPLRRGLLGVRLLLTRPERAADLMHVADAAELKSRFVKGYGHAWLDRPAMAAMGFRMELGTSYAGLFDMLRARRFDYLHRGVNELRAELADPRLAGRGLVVVPGIALYYPLDDYFFVTPGRPDLARAIDRGFQRALEDGSYAALFQRHFGAAMREAELESRSILHLTDYPVPAGTPLEEFDVLGLVRSVGVFRLPAPAPPPPPASPPR